jgi:hypothetical protein
MKNKLKITTVITISILLLSFMNMPSRTDWEKLGSKIVNMHADHDEIIVTAHDGLFTKLKFKVLKAPLFLHNINVIFGNGSSENIVFNKKFTPGTESRVIDLPGNKRIIKKINLNYKTPKNPKGKSMIVLFGKH